MKIEALRASVKDAEARLADAKRGREEEEEGESSSSRASKMARRSELLAEINAARIELEKLRQNDPKEIANLEKEFDLVRSAAHRWTDNIFSCMDYLVKKRGMMKAEGERVRQFRFLLVAPFSIFPLRPLSIRPCIFILFCLSLSPLLIKTLSLSL